MYNRSATVAKVTFASVVCSHCAFTFCNGEKLPSSLSFAKAIAKIRVNEEEMRLRWIKDEDNWRKLPARAWPEHQPDAEAIPMLESKVANSCVRGDSPACRDAKFDLATALVFNHVNVDKGVAIYESLAGGGDERGMSALGICLIEGLGVPTDYKIGSRWLKKANEMGYAQGTYELAVLYYTGAASPFIEEDSQTAFNLFQLAAKQEHTSALFMEADMLLTGDGCEKDVAKAVDLLYRAGERGHRFARATLLNLLRDENIVIAELEKNDQDSKRG